MEKLKGDQSFINEWSDVEGLSLVVYPSGWNLFAANICGGFFFRNHYLAENSFCVWHPEDILEYNPKNREKKLLFIGFDTECFSTDVCSRIQSAGYQMFGLINQTCGICVYTIESGFAKISNDTANQDLLKLVAAKSLNEYHAFNFVILEMISNDKDFPYQIVEKINTICDSIDIDILSKFKEIFEGISKKSPNDCQNYINQEYFRLMGIREITRNNTNIDINGLAVVKCPKELDNKDRESIIFVLSQICGVIMITEPGTGEYNQYTLLVNNFEYHQFDPQRFLQTNGVETYETDKTGSRFKIMAANQEEAIKLISEALYKKKMN